MSDRVVLLRQGKIEQVGSPRDLYDRPASRYVADFIGETNLVSGIVIEGGRGPLVIRANGLLLKGWSETNLAAGASVSLSIRPEAIRLLDSGNSTENVVEGVVAEVVYLGALVRVHLSWGENLRLVFHAPAATVLSAGTPVRVGWSMRQARCVTD